MNEWDRFLEFEKKNQLFDITDNEGTNVWNLIRLYVYTKIAYGNTMTITNNEKTKKTITDKLRSLIVIFRWLLKRRKKFFFFLASRNTKDGQVFDQNIIQTLNQFQVNDCFLMESYADINDKRLMYSRTPCPELEHYLSPFIRNKYDFNNEIKILKSSYRDIEITEHELLSIYRSFYSQYYFYKWFFKKFQFEKIFLTQNSLQQGMYRAAHELKIPVYEFQHGIVNKAHMAYSYPEGIIDLKNKIYVADIIFSIAPFWFKDVYNPYSTILPIGNDYFAPNIVRDKIEKGSFIVVSANVFGANLSKIVLEMLLKGNITSNIYFKLHPNQFFEKEYYLEEFKAFPNVKVISNEESMQSLLSRVENMLVIQSTAVYEALFSGVKVFIYKKQSYFVHQDIFDHEGVYLVDNVDRIISILSDSKDIILQPDKTFFSHYDKEKLLKALI